MKVHPEMFMKTKERGKVSVPCVQEDAWGLEVRSPRQAGGVIILTSGSCLLTSVSKNEGASGDVHENKGTGEKSAFPMSGKMPEASKSQGYDGQEGC
jgi:hypothetical protein